MSQINPAAPSATPPLGDFERLSPDRILMAVEWATDHQFTGLTTPLQSHINRVYERMDEDGTRLVVKFYRPGRWEPEAIREEHALVKDCVDAEIPDMSKSACDTPSTVLTKRIQSAYSYPVTENAHAVPS
ncbi:MAG: hypothetical protein CSA22_02845 [Deltaproteobacteria bacterium]|nr:MAG: hypothetical protein CSA22_02845 [Deltaproteobacteria bacterium]